MNLVRPSDVPPRYRYATLGAAAAAVFLASVVDPGAAGASSPSTGPLGLLGVDKWVHAGAYATLSFLGAYALADRPTAADDATTDGATTVAKAASERGTATDRRVATGRATRLRTLALVVVCVAAFGAGVEAVQATLPARSFDVVDMAANATGALAAAGAWSAVTRSPRAPSRRTDR